MIRSCQDGVGLLMDYLEGALAPDLKAAIDVHVQGCARCRAFVESYQLTPHIMREATMAQMPADLSRSLQEFVRRLTRASDDT